MQIIRTPAEMHQACRNLRSLALVPTMGALHPGHLSLVAAARAECAHIAASIFVNPTQFAPNEDYTTYPRTFEDDCHQLEAANVDILFAPTAADMYPPTNTTLIDPGPIATRLDGASRPGHFRGVATIVTRLFNIVQPHRAYFGQKDAAQVAVIRSITRDLNLPVHIAVCPIVREPDGLALSSRNRYLSPDERTRALILHRALTAAANLAAQNQPIAHPLNSTVLNQAQPRHPQHCHPERSAAKSQDLRLAMLEVLATDPTIRLDYAAIVDPETLLPIPDTSQPTLIAIAAWIGQTRLIDNLLLPSA